MAVLFLLLGQGSLEGELRPERPRRDGRTQLVSAGARWSTHRRAPGRRPGGRTAWWWRWPRVSRPPARSRRARRRWVRGRTRAGRPPHPSARAGSRGGRDDRDRHPGRRPRADSPRWWPCPTPTRRSTRPSRSATSSPWPTGPWPRWRWPGPSPWTGPASGWPPWPSWPPSGCGCSPTTATGCSRPG